METLADRLRSERTAAGLSQAQLAKIAGIRQQAISGIEQGITKGTRHLVPIAAALGLNPDWLQTGQGRKEAIKWDQVFDLDSLPEPARDAALRLFNAVVNGELSSAQLVAFVNAILHRDEKHL